MSSILTLDHLFKQHPAIQGKRVLVRVDFNVPMQHGKIIDDTRVKAIIPTIKELSEKGAIVILLSHFGRPEGKFERSLSLAPVMDTLEPMLPDTKVLFALDCVGELAEEAIKKAEPGDVILMENLRFHEGEERNDVEFARTLAEMADAYVNDAFSASHRAHASVDRITYLLPNYAGRSFVNELQTLQKLWTNAEKPMVAICGGAKVSTKIDLLKSMVEKVDALVLGGGIANTFLVAMGYGVGKSLHEPDHVNTAKEIIRLSHEHQCELIVPSDGVVANSLEDKNVTVMHVGNIPAEGMLLDIGPDTLARIYEVLKKAKSVMWNGPVGAFEYGVNHTGSIEIARMIASLTHQRRVLSIAGGGDVLALINKAGVYNQFSYISTAGGAFLEWLGGTTLPGITALGRQQVREAEAS